MNKTKYEKELKKAFLDWFEEKSESIYDIGENSQKFLIQNLGTSEQKFYKKYIEPIAKLNNLQLYHFFKALSYNLADRFSPLPYIIKYQITHKMNPEPNAMNWLLVQLNNIALFDFINDIDYYEEPYRQCIKCGKPDYYEVLDINNKPHREYFDNRKHFCHGDNCYTLNATNPEYHDKDDKCHYATFARKKKTLIDRIKKADKAEDAVKIFIDFCEKQLYDNLTIEYAVRPKEVFDMKEFGYSKLSDFWNDTEDKELFFDDNTFLSLEIDKWLKEQKNKKQE